VVTLFTSPPDLSVVFSLFCLFVFVVCLVLLSLVAAVFLANKDVYQCLKFCDDTPSAGTLPTLNNPGDLDSECSAASFLVQ